MAVAVAQAVHGEVVPALRRDVVRLDLRDDLLGVLAEAAAIAFPRLGDGGRRAVHEGRVGGVDAVLDRQLPVAAEELAEAAAAKFHLAARRAVDEIVDRVGDRGQELGEVGTGLAQANEDEAAVGGDRGDALQAALVAVGCGARAVVLAPRHRDQAAVAAVDPAMVGAVEGLGAAVMGADDLRPAMRAAIVQPDDGAVVAAHDEDVVTPDRRPDEVAGPRDLALVPDIDPAALEDARHLEGEDVGVGVDPAVDAPGLHERTDLVDIGHGGQDITNRGIAGPRCGPRSAAQGRDRRQS